MTVQPKWALGTLEMVKRAILVHRRRTGANPQRIELHPAVCAELYSDPKIQQYCDYQGIWNSPTFMDVEIRPARIEWPRLIGHDGTVEEL